MKQKKHHGRLAKAAIIGMGGGIALLATTVLNTPAAADCMEDVRAVFRDALDTTIWTPHVSVVTTRSAQGRVLTIIESQIESPFRTIATIKGSATSTLSYDGRIWTGPSPQGPWTPAPVGMVPQQLKTLQDQHAQQLSNLSSPECPGETDLEGKRVLVYGYFTKTNPDPSLGGFWYGGKARAYIDPATRQVLRWDQFETVGSMTFGSPGDVTEARYSYDPTLKISAP